MRTILAFDASCGKCTQISQRVAEVAGDRLEILPLTHPEVESWRRDAFGNNAPWVPTLVRINDGRSRVFIGRRMAFPLMRTLGPRATLRVISTLGEFAVGESKSVSRDAGSPMARKAFLRLGAGVVAAGGMILAGQNVSFASADERRMREWFAANSSNLPQQYNEIVALPAEYRRHVLATLSPQAKSQAWLENIAAFRRSHPHLSPTQNAVLDQARTTMSNPDLFVKSSGLADKLAQSTLPEDVKQAFEPADRWFVLSLGPEVAAPGSVASTCQCSGQADFCSGNTNCLTSSGVCSATPAGCGWGGLYRCDGLCFS